jgi:hypothetical protein
LPPPRFRDTVSVISVSVVIPTLNEATNIEALVRALLGQDFGGKFEIIVVDGGSTDATREIVNAVALDDSRVLLLQAHRGVSGQRNLGASRATGELIVFMDADNRPSPQFIACVAASYERLPFAVACPWFVARDSGSLVALAYFGFNVLFWLSQSTLRTGSGVCIITPRKIFEKCGGFDESLQLGEDVKLIRTAAPRYGLHRHLLVALETSGRRFKAFGFSQLMKFYLRITPLILLGRWRALQKIGYTAAPYDDEESNKKKHSASPATGKAE